MRTNDEIRMTKDEGMTKLELRHRARTRTRVLRYQSPLRRTARCALPGGKPTLCPALPEQTLCRHQPKTNHHPRVRFQVLSFLRHSSFELRHFDGVFFHPHEKLLDSGHNDKGHIFSGTLIP